MSNTRKPSDADEALKNTSAGISNAATALKDTLEVIVTQKPFSPEKKALFEKSVATLADQLLGAAQKNYEITYQGDQAKARFTSKSPSNKR